MSEDAAYREAEKKIEEAQRSGAKQLDLGVGYGDQKPKLTQLPDSLGQLSRLQSLDLSNNQLTELPESLYRLMQLQSLDLSGNSLKELPEWLVQLTQLQSLDLSSNPLKELPEGLVQLARLESLKLCGSGLTALPESLGQLTQLQSLDLSNNHLTELPESLHQLTQLRSLNLSHNRLSMLPDSLGQLTQLQSFELWDVPLKTLPVWVRQFTQLRTLVLVKNGLESLPEWVGELKSIEQLDLWGNPLTKLPSELASLPNLRKFSFNSPVLTELPEELFKLSRLKRLDISGFSTLTVLSKAIGQLTEMESMHLTRSNVMHIPDEICHLRNLKTLDLGGNLLAELPSSLAQLDHLENLDLTGNPLSIELAAANKAGLDAVKRYLREIAKGGKNRYEAKLLILGDGNEGKTCVSRALRGLPFEEQKTTHGVDVEQWTFPYPEDAANREKDITLNIWDFEGQEISHQTHQFFLTSHALYLLVFKCRDQFLVDRAEYWLDTIRARAPRAKVAIVISQCEARSPHLPLDKIAAQYGEMLANEWFFPVGCENGKNIKKLQSFLQNSAADLEFMGARWPDSYEKAEAEIKKTADADTAHLSRAALNGHLRKAGVNEDNYDGAARAMARIGAITQFPDSLDLGDFVVLKPQWLTKAISKVMEDGKLSEDKGEIEMSRMATIWNQAGYHGMFATFHNCMKEFELCYDLEDAGHCCLVPLRFGYVAPPIPSTDGSGLKERRMEYKLNIRPPMGIMSRFIVKTHHMIARTVEHPKGIYWHNGVFLRTGGQFPSEALCDFAPDERILRVQVRAAFPQNLCEQIHAYVQAVFSFFGGLSAERSYGCIKANEDTGAETQCVGLHTEKRIYTAISKRRETMDCEFEDHEVDPRLLVCNMTSFGEFVAERLTADQLAAIVRREVDKTPEWAEPFLRTIHGFLDWVKDNSRKLDQVLLGQVELSAEFKQEAELKLNDYLGFVSAMLDDRDHMAAPRLISIMTKDGSPWNPTRFFKQTYILTPYCECEGNIHPCQDANVEFTKDKAWWAASAPWVARGTKLLAAGLQVAFAGMPLALGTDAAKAVEAQVRLMQELTKHLKLEAPSEARDYASAEVLGGGVRKDLRGNDRETALTRAALARLLEETAPNNYHARRWGSLRRVRMSDNSYRWVCEACSALTG